MLQLSAITEHNNLIRRYHYSGNNLLDLIAQYDLRSWSAEDLAYQLQQRPLLLGMLRDVFLCEFRNARTSGLRQFALQQPDHFLRFFQDLGCHFTWEMIEGVFIHARISRISCFHRPDRQVFIYTVSY
jgi:hypothetical protein